MSMKRISLKNRLSMFPQANSRIKTNPGKSNTKPETSSSPDKERSETTPSLSSDHDSNHLSEGDHKRPNLDTGRRYGYFECKECRHFWESSYSWVRNGRPYAQKCHYCKIMTIPYAQTLLDKQAYAHYECDCGRYWNDYCYMSKQQQECDECGELVKPYEIEGHGFYRCYHCKEEWDGYCNLLDAAQKCYCGKNVKPYETRVSNIDPNKPHEESLCEKCIELGHPCTKGDIY